MDPKTAPAIAFVSLIATVMITAESRAQPASPLKPPPDIVALMPSGEYAGQGYRQGGRFALTLEVEENQPGGRFSGTAVVEHPIAACSATFPIRGVMKPDGTVTIRSGTAQTSGCERHFDLQLAGDDLHGTMKASGERYAVRLKRQQ